MVSQSQRVRVRAEKGTARRAVRVSDADTVTVRFQGGEEASVPSQAVEELRDFEAKEPLSGIIGPLSLEEAQQLRSRAEELLKLGDAEAAAEWCSAGIQRLALQLEGGAEQQVLALRGKEIWEGSATQADEAGTSKVRFARLLECPELRGLLKNSKNGKVQVEAPPEQMMPNERLCGVHGGKLGLEQMELLLCRARCWMALDAAQRAVLDCSCALAVCRRLTPPPPARAPGFELTVPLLVLGIAMAVGGQYVVGTVLCCAAFLWDYVCQQRAKRAAADANMAQVLALRGRAKLQQGLSGLANHELRWATDVLGPLDEGSEIKKLRRELRLAKGEEGRAKRPLIAPADAAKRTWKTDAVERIVVNAFLSAQNLECHGQGLTIADAQAKEDQGDDRFNLGYMDYVGDGFQAM